GKEKVGSFRRVKCVGIAFQEPHKPRKAEWVQPEPGRGDTVLRQPDDDRRQGLCNAVGKTCEQPAGMLRKCRADISMHAKSRLGQIPRTGRGIRSKRRCWPTMARSASTGSDATGAPAIKEASAGGGSSGRRVLPSIIAWRRLSTSRRVSASID